MRQRDHRSVSVLVVEDDPGGRELLEDLLREDGHSVETVADGAAAWTRLVAGPPTIEVVLLDWGLPGMSGLELLQRIKGDPALESIAVIFQTARSDRESLVAAVAGGAAYLLPKPIDRELLQTVVGAATADLDRNRELHEMATRSSAAASTLVDGRFHFHTIAEANALATLLSRACPLPDKTATGLAELLINAVEHGNLGITYEEKTQLLAAQLWTAEVERRLASAEHRDKRAEIHYQRDGERISFTITDCGKGFDWQRFLTISPDRLFHPHGRGIAMANLMSFDRLEYVAPGNRVIAILELAKP